MKKNFLCTSACFLTVGVMLSTGVFAQTTPASSNSKPAATTTSAQKPSATHHEVTKEEWLKQYNEMKPKFEELARNAKTETKHPELMAETNKLSTMANNFKSKVDGMDKVSDDKREAYNNDLRASHKALNEQYMKAKGMWDQIHAGQKDDTKTAPAPQTPK